MMMNQQSFCGLIVLSLLATVSTRAETLSEPQSTSAARGAMAAGMDMTPLITKQISLDEIAENLKMLQSS